MSIATSVGENPWFAIRVKPRHEKVVAASLTSKGYEGFLPLYQTRRRWSDRTKVLELPLFPGYLFCRLDPRRRLPVLKTPGVRYFLGVGRTPMPVDEKEVEAIRRVVESGLPTNPWPYLEHGQRAIIKHGPLTGLEGVFLEMKGTSRLVVSVTLLQRSVSVEIDGAWVKPMGTIHYSSPR